MVLAQAYLWCLRASVAERLHLSRRGQGLVEYSLIIAVVAVAAILGLTVFGGKLQTAFMNITQKLGVPTDTTPIVTCTPTISTPC